MSASTYATESSQQMIAFCKNKQPIFYVKMYIFY